MQPSQMVAQVTEEQAIKQFKHRKLNLKEALRLKKPENEAISGMIQSITATKNDLAQVFPMQVVDGYLKLLECQLSTSNSELDSITNELVFIDQVLAQAASPILVPGRGSVMGGGGIRQF